ncbi:MAG: putative permease [Sphingomonadales bacterium]|nr:putative permease [Sphingomonadales bacterium]
MRQPRPPRREAPEMRPAGAGPSAFALAAAGTVVALWLLYQILTAILIFFLALVTAIALSGLVRWLQARGMRRGIAVALSVLGFIAFLVALFILIIPPIGEQASTLLPNLPGLVSKGLQRITSHLGDYPQLQQSIQDQAKGSAQLPSLLEVAKRIGGVSLSLIGGFALLIIYLSAVLYLTADPLPLMRGYVASLPRHHRAAGIRAYRGASQAVFGWMKASIIIGPVEALASGVFLTLMGVPGALVWAALAFFAEFVPRIGGYVMAIPPVIVALSVGVPTALWTAFFYFAMTELLGTLVAPVIRGTAMRIHPAVLLFATLASALAFGFLGALVGAPAAAFGVAYYREFYVKRPDAGAVTESSHRDYEVRR